MGEPDPILPARGAHDERLHELEHSVRALWREIHSIKENQMSEQEQVSALEAAVAKVAEDLATTKSTLQTELDALQAQINSGEQPNLTKLTEAVNTLDPAVQALAGLKPEASAQPTSETVTVPIGASGEGSVAVQFAASRLSITTPPSSGTATLTAVEGAEATTLLVTGGTPETSETVVLSIAAE
jgi:hypothetical protein